MIEIIIDKNLCGQRMDKFLKKYLNTAPQSFIYKMLRKKNITLNDKKSDGSNLLVDGDKIKLFLSDETINSFRNDERIAETVKKAVGNSLSKSPLSVLYEDEDIILVNKSAGVLSQKSEKGDISINELILDYLISAKAIDEVSLRTFKPSVCNRLDRNTSGIITFGKTLTGSQFLSKGFKDRTFHKYYLCIVKGVINKKAVIDGYISKDEKSNKVTVSKVEANGLEPIKTEYIPVSNNGRFTFLKIKLHTGKTHQIRAHLAYIGHPLVGDFKYGNKEDNKIFNSKYGISHQLLHSFELYIPQKDLRIYAEIPLYMIKFLKGEDLWEPGKQEALEALH